MAALADKTNNSMIIKRRAGAAGVTQGGAQKKQKSGGAGGAGGKKKGVPVVLRPLLECILYSSATEQKWRQVPRHDDGHRSSAKVPKGKDSELICLKGMVETILDGTANAKAQKVIAQGVQGFNQSFKSCNISGIDSSKSTSVNGVPCYANTFYVDPGDPLYAAPAVIEGNDHFSILQGVKVRRISAIGGDGKCTVRLDAAPHTEGVVLHDALGDEVETLATRRFKVDPARPASSHP